MRYTAKVSHLFAKLMHFFILYFIKAKISLWAFVLTFSFGIFFLFVAHVHL